MADTTAIIAGRQLANTPSIMTVATALAANPARAAWFLQNLGTNAVYVRLGANASTTVFHFALKGGTTNDDGTGASVGQSAGTVYTGTITVAGTSPRYTVLEQE